MGDLIVAPLLLLWLSMPFWKPRRVELFEGFALLALIAVVSWFVFLHGYWRYPHLLFPLLIWAALRFSQRGAVTGSFVVAAFAIKGAIDGTTPLTGGSVTEVVQVAEGLLAAVIVSLLFLGAALSERRSAEVALQHERANLAEAQELAHIGSWEWSIADNRVGWSDELFRIYGLSPLSEVTYGSYLEQVHPDDRELVREAVARSLVDAAPFSFEHRVVRPDGTIRWVHGQGRVILDAVRHATAPGRHLAGHHRREEPRSASREHPRDGLARAADTADVDPRLRTDSEGEGFGTRRSDADRARRPPAPTGPETRSPALRPARSRPAPTGVDRIHLPRHRRRRARPPGRRRLPDGWPSGRSQCPTSRRGGRRSEARADRREPLGERGQAHAAGNRRGRPSRTGGSGPANRSGRLGRRRSGG